MILQAIAAMVHRTPSPRLFLCAFSILDVGNYASRIENVQFSSPYNALYFGCAADAAPPKVYPDTQTCLRIMLKLLRESDMHPKS